MDYPEPAPAPAPASALLPASADALSPRTKVAGSTSSAAARASAASSLGEYRRADFNYSTLARQVGEQPGLAIFRRFAALNAKSLLYLQAELAELEDSLKTLESRDERDPAHREYQWVARELMNAPVGEDHQWLKVKEIREKLKLYSGYLSMRASRRRSLTEPLDELLLQQNELHKLAAPNPYDLTHLREWLTDKRYGARFLEPPEDAWDPEFAADLVALSRRDKEGDVFSRWFSSSLWPWIHRNILHPAEDQPLATARRASVNLLRRTSSVFARLGRRTKARGDGEADESAEDLSHFKGLARQGTTIVARKTAGGSVMYYYPDWRLNRATEVVSIVVSSLLPTASIVALNYIPPSPAIARLSFILVFSGFFTLCLALFTEARRIEIFAAAVALASVQVVFIGTASVAGG